MDKLKLAHSYMVEYVKKNGLDVSYSDVSAAFDIAEAMLAEQEKRTTILDEFQVDWSQAPEWANWWAVDSNMMTNWYDEKPVISGSNNEWTCTNGGDYEEDRLLHGNLDWRNSLQERK